MALNTNITTTTCKINKWMNSQCDRGESNTDIFAVSTIGRWELILLRCCPTFKFLDEKNESIHDNFWKEEKEHKPDIIDNSYRPQRHQYHHLQNCAEESYENYREKGKGREMLWDREREFPLHMLGTVLYLYVQISVIWKVKVREKPKNASKTHKIYTENTLTHIHTHTVE